MPHTTRIPEGKQVIRDQTGATATLLRYERKRGAMIPVIQFLPKVLASGELKPSAEWECKSRLPDVTPMQHFQLHYSAKE